MTGSDQSPIEGLSASDYQEFVVDLAAGGVPKELIRPRDVAWALAGSYVIGQLKGVMEPDAAAKHLPSYMSHVPESTEGIKAIAPLIMYLTLDEYVAAGGSGEDLGPAKERLAELATQQGFDVAEFQRQRAATRADEHMASATPVTEVRRQAPGVNPQESPTAGPETPTRRQGWLARRRRGGR